MGYLKNTRTRCTTSLHVFLSPRLITVDPYAMPRLGFYSASNNAAGVHGPITRFVTTIQSSTATATYHFFELDAQSLETNWLEKDERRREWVDFAEAVRRLAWKPELAQGLMLSSLAPKR